MLKDDGEVLVNAQEGKTVAMRQLRFSTEQNLNEEQVVNFIHEAIDNQKAGLSIKAKPKWPLDIPPELQQHLLGNVELNAQFAQLDLSKQREYVEYITTAKRDSTKQSRLEKITPMILQGVGLNDKYR